MYKHVNMDNLQSIKKCLYSEVDDDDTKISIFVASKRIASLMFSHDSSRRDYFFEYTLTMDGDVPICVSLERSRVHPSWRGHSSSITVDSSKYLGKALQMHLPWPSCSFKTIIKERSLLFACPCGLQCKSVYLSKVNMSISYLVHDKTQSRRHKGKKKIAAAPKRGVIATVPTTEELVGFFDSMDDSEKLSVLGCDTKRYLEHVDLGDIYSCPKQCESVLRAIKMASAGSYSVSVSGADLFKTISICTERSHLLLEDLTVAECFSFLDNVPEKDPLCLPQDASAILCHCIYFKLVGMFCLLKADEEAAARERAAALLLEECGREKADVSSPKKKVSQKQKKEMARRQKEWVGRMIEKRAALLRECFAIELEAEYHLKAAMDMDEHVQFLLKNEGGDDMLHFLAQKEYHINKNRELSDRALALYYDV